MSSRSGIPLKAQYHRDNTTASVPNVLSSRSDIYPSNNVISTLHISPTSLEARGSRRAEPGCQPEVGKWEAKTSSKQSQAPVVLPLTSRLTSGAKNWDGHLLPTGENARQSSR